MLTFEKVLEIFADYLTADETIEVYISRHGCVRVEFDQDFHYCSGEVCHTPKELFDLLADDYSNAGYDPEESTQNQIYAGLRCDTSSAAAHLHHQSSLCGCRSKDSAIPCRTRKQQNNYGHLCKSEVQ